LTRWIVQLQATSGADLDVLPGSAGRNLKGSLRAGDATWDVASLVLPEPGVDGVETLEAVAVAPLFGALVPFTGARVKRAFLFRVHADTPDVITQRFEAELAAMPRLVRTIHSWALSRVDQSVSHSFWTHIWEQEFASLDDLNGDYAMHPYHWAGVDRWFDPEMPDAIVDRRLAQWLYEAPGPVLR